MSWIVGSAVDEAVLTLRIIAGPTGAGKSAIAMDLAARHGAMIISADSRQIYRGFDIGTAKPTGAERAVVRHEGIDIADPQERWSAARWAESTSGWISAAEERRQPVIVVGGTGLWLRALVRPLADEPDMDPVRRAELQATLAALDTATLKRWVETLDPERAGFGRTQLLRAIEVALLTGTRLSDWHAAGSEKPRRTARWLIVDPGPVLHVALSARIDAMLAAGWEEEVRALSERVPADAPAWNACGYSEVREMVERRLSPEAARERILVGTRRYAKRQRTWFRNQLDGETAVTRIDPRSSGAATVTERWYHGEEHA